MSNISKLKYFYDNQENERERESFQSTLFENLDFNRRSKPISFHRSDFRGAKFVKCKFRKNNFSRCDFISAVIQESVFQECDFKSAAIINSLITNSTIKESTSNSADIVRCAFYDCDIEKEVFNRAVWRDVSFNSTTLTNCNIERSTIENIIFHECNIQNLNLSHLLATDIKFEKTSLDNVIVDPDYMGTYLFDYESLCNLKFMYKGELLEIDSEDTEGLIQLSEYMYDNSRFSESYNIIAIVNMLKSKKENLSQLWLSAFELSIHMPNYIDAVDNVKRLFKSLLHYVKIDLVSITDLTQVLVSINLKYESIYDFQMKDVISTEISRLNKFVEECEYQTSHLTNKNALDKRILAHFTFDELDEEDAVSMLRNIFNIILPDEYRSYSIVSVKNGSIIIEVAMYLVATLFIAKTIRQISGHTFRVILEYKAFKHLAKEIDNQGGLDKFRDIADANLFLSDGLQKDNQLKAHLSKLKELKLFVNNDRDPLD